MKSKIALTIRAKKLGILLRDARQTAGKSLKECGQAIGVSSATISSYERGQKSPSLPEIELLAYFLKVPLEHFWKDQVASDLGEDADSVNIEHTLALRNRQIGKYLEEARENKNIHNKEIQEITQISPGRIKRFEKGETPVPLPELEMLSNLFDIPIHSLVSTETEAGQWIHAQASISGFLALSSEMQDFVGKPVNHPYLEIADKLSRMSANELRQIAETLLEITI